MHIVEAKGILSAKNGMPDALKLVVRMYCSSSLR